MKKSGKSKICRKKKNKPGKLVCCQKEGMTHVNLDLKVHPLPLLGPIYHYYQKKTNNATRFYYLKKSDLLVRNSTD